MRFLNMSDLLYQLGHQIIKEKNSLELRILYRKIQVTYSQDYTRKYI